MLYLDNNDIDQLKSVLGHSQKPVTIPRELYDTLLYNYQPHHFGSVGFALARQIRELSEKANDDAR